MARTMRSKQSKPIKTLTRATKDNLPLVKAYLKSQLPVVTPLAIRSYQLPYHEAAVLELEDNGMSDAAEFFKHVIQLSKSSKNDENLLTNQTALIDKLKNYLIASEIEKKNNVIQQIEILYNATSYFRFLSWQWSWIVEELFKKMLIVSYTIDDDKFINNIIKYSYAQYLFESRNNCQMASKYLGEVQDNSRGKNWNPSAFLKVKKESLFEESCSLMSKILMTLSRKLRVSDPIKSITMAQDALKHAVDSKVEKNVSSALYEVGKSQIDMGKFKEALRTFSKYLALVKRQLDYEGICIACRELAYIHKELGSKDGAVSYYYLFQDYACEFKLNHIKPEAHYCIGNFLFNEGNPRRACIELAKAFDQYKKLNMVNGMNKSRYLLGIAQGEEVMEEYMQLILECGKKDPKAIKKLLDWKNDRIPFWN